MTSEQTIQEARRVLNLDLISARLGKGDGTGTVYDLNNQGNYWVRKIEANGNLSQAFSLPVNPLASIPPSDGLAVSIGYDIRGIQCIWQADNISLKAANINPLILNPLDSAVYGKTSQTNISTLLYQRHGNSTLFPFTVVVFKAPTIINGNANMFPGSSVDLASFVPSTGFKCYACVFLRTDMTLEAFASTPINDGDPLQMNVDIQECIDASSTNSVIICAYEIRGDDTALSPDPTRNVDMRQIVNMPQTVNSSAFPIHTTIWQRESVLLVGSSTWSYTYASAPYGFIVYQAAAADGDSWQTQPFQIAAGTYTFHVLGATDTDRGKIDWYLDDKLIPFEVGQDWNAALAYGVEKTASITIPANGNHTITGIINGTSGGAGSYYHALVTMWIS